MPNELEIFAVVPLVPPATPADFTRRIAISLTRTFPRPQIFSVSLSHQFFHPVSEKLHVSLTHT